MATTSNKSKYSTYAGLDPTAPVNWGNIANTISQQIGIFKKERQANQQKVEDETQSTIEKLNELPEIKTGTLGKRLLESAEAQTKMIQMNMGLVRKGVYTISDYKIRLNQMKNDMTNMKNITKVYDPWFQEKKKKIDAGLASEAEMAFAKRIESFGNLDNKKFITNPANAQLQVVTMLEDKDPDSETFGQFVIMPDPKENPDNFQAPGTILNLMTYDAGPPADLDADADLIVDSLGKIIESYVLPSGETVTIENFRRMFDDPSKIKDLGLGSNITTFDDWLNSQSAKLTSTDEKMVQILVKHGGYQFDDPSADNYIKMRGTGNKVVFGKDGKGLDDDDIKAAQAIVKEKIGSRIDAIEKRERGFDDSNLKYKKDQDTETKSSVVQLYNNIMTDPSNNLQKLNEDDKFKDVESLVMEDKDGKVTENKDDAVRMRFVKLEDGEQKTTYVELREEIDGSRIDTRKTIKKTDGTIIPNPNLGKPNKQVSNEKILEGYLGNLGIPDEEISEYMKAYKKSGGKIDKFTPKNYNRESDKLVNTSAQEIKRKNGKTGSAGLVVTEVLENKAEADSPFKALETAANAADAPDRAKEEFKEYKVNMISSYVEDALGTKLRGKPFTLRLNSDDSITLKFNNVDYKLPQTLSGYNTKGQLMVNNIEQLINLDRLPLGTCVDGKLKMQGGVITNCTE